MYKIFSKKVIVKFALIFFLARHCFISHFSCCHCLYLTYCHHDTMKRYDYVRALVICLAYQRCIVRLSAHKYMWGTYICTYMYISLLRNFWSLSEHKHIHMWWGDDHDDDDDFTDSGNSYSTATGYTSSFHHIPNDRPRAFHTYAHMFCFETRNFVCDYTIIYALRVKWNKKIKRKKFIKFIRWFGGKNISFSFFWFFFFILYLSVLILKKERK